MTDRRAEIMKCISRKWFIYVVLLVMTLLAYPCKVQAAAGETTQATNVSDTAPSESETGKKQIVKLKKPAITSVAATTKGTIELQWKKVKGANRYEIYRKKKNQKNYVRIAWTQKLKYTDKKGKKNTTYYYKIRAVYVDGQKNITGASSRSQRHKCKVRNKNPKVAYVGDSIMTGFSGYGILRGRKNSRVFAAVGMNTWKFNSSKEMQALLQYNPDRMYIMMGVNSLWSSDSDALNSLLESYEKIIKKCRKRNANIEIFVIGVAPVGRNASVSSNAVRKFNSLLKKMASKMESVYYYSLSDSLADSNGYLLSKYAAGDGVHWRRETYDYVLKKWDSYTKKVYWK